MAKPKLTYFSARGLAEPIVLLLKDAAVDYEPVYVGQYNPNDQPQGFKDLKDAKV